MTHFISFLLVSLSVLLCNCSSKGPLDNTTETYRSCIERQDVLRKNMFLAVPENFRVPFSGYHPITKYYNASPSVAQLRADVDRLEKENNSFDARTEYGSKNFDARFLDTSPGRNRILVSFERHRNYLYGSKKDVLLFRIDYSKPAITFTCPVESFRDNTTSLTCQLQGKTHGIKGLEGAHMSFKYDLRLRLVPINKNYFYFEWVSSGDRWDKDLSEDHYQLRALVYSNSEDRFFKHEFPYLDPAGDLNPESCSELEGA